MKVLIIPDSFKGCMTAQEVASVMKKAVKIVAVHGSALIIILIAVINLIGH